MANEDEIRLGVFLATFVLVATWEILAPRRSLNYSRRIRWFSNIGLSVLNQLLMRLFFPVVLFGLAVELQRREWGLFNLFDIPAVLAVVLCLLLLDLTIYIQHRVFHRVTWLWRLHRVHHTDLDLDVTTAIRFHPVEIILSLLIKMVAVTLLGTPPLAILIFEIVLNLTALFNHGNIAISLKLERLLRLLVVTPDMHRVHHSVRVGETNSNYGFNLPWWDYLFGTYCDQPDRGHREMKLGLEEFPSEQQLSFTKLLILPFQKH